MTPRPRQPEREALLHRLGTLDRETATPPRATLPGVQLINPLNQGDLDGLCGLYCIINAIRLVLAPHRELQDREARLLFRAGLRFIDEQSNLLRAVPKSVGRKRWPLLAERLSVSAERLSGIPIVLERPLLPNAPPTAEETLIAIEMMIHANKAPMVFVRGEYRHYTVICGYTPKSLRLFDSFGYHWVRRTSCGPVASAKSLHRFHLSSLIAVSAKCS